MGASASDLFRDGLVTRKASLVDNYVISDFGAIRGDPPDLGSVQGIFSAPAEYSSLSNTFTGTLRDSLNEKLALDNTNFVSSYDVAGYGYGKTLAFLNTLQDVGTFLSLRAKNDITAIINTLMSPVITQLDAAKELDKDNMSRNYVANYGFFNTNILNRLTEITNRYALAKADILAKFNFQYRELYDRTGLQALQLLATYRNQPLNEKLESDKLRFVIQTGLSGARSQARAVGLEYLSKGILYAKDESHRIYTNVMHNHFQATEADRWLAEMYNLLGSGTDAAGGKNKVAAALSGAVSGATAGLAVGTAIPGVGNVAGTIGGAATGFFAGLLS